MLIALAAGCAQEEGVAEEAVVADAAPAAGVGTDAVVEPVVGADPALAGAGVGGEARAERANFGAWDTNADGMLDNNEFRSRFNDGGWYGDWDGDRNGQLTNEEFGTVNTTWGQAPEGVETNSLFGTWDADKDGMLANDEAATGAFSAWDRDRNNMVDTNEFNAGINWFGR
ncbi:hypothetical protein GCM10007067_17600 [Lysobacter bugurensis]|uniref:EF-hand domain-containing protein n=1 Tax=Cognatilysobacter bugurensis TaxID=543356 RepID=A0A918T2K4_9GAMM|nr:hypothetical protein GCM10007067_17600 [Lysobacter bugurensis]